MEIRPLTLDDVHSANSIDRAAFGADGQTPPPGRIRDGQDRIAHLVLTDPRGAWLALEGDEPVGAALALRRERVWGLSLLAVVPRSRGRGVGGLLLEAASDYSEHGDAGIILSSADPRALRSYSRLGFELRATVDATGVVRRESLAEPRGVRPGSAGDLAETAAISRAVRGASQVTDLPLWLDMGRTLLIHESGFAVHAGGSPVVLAALEEDSAVELLTACLLDSAPGSEVEVHHITSGNDWAVRTALDAGLALAPGGPVFVRDLSAPLAPYLPSGSFL